MKIFNAFLLLICITTITLKAQTEKEAIYVTINNYIEGTSFNKKELIEKAFYKEADLFLDNKDKTLWVVPISEYAGWYEKKEYGKFNGRLGDIISVDVYQNIATAKAEILISESNLRFIDLFLLKKINDEWKIISKTASSNTSNKQGKRILFVTSNAEFYGDSDLPTGNSFSEIVHAYNTFSEAGYSIDFVSPLGGAIPLAYINTSEKIEKNYLYNYDFMYGLKNTLAPAVIKTELYKAVYYVGGGGAMFGVPENEKIQQIAMTIYEQNMGIISSVCHGTAGIVHLKTEDGKYLVAGKNVNGYPDSFENHEAAYFKQFPFLIQKTIEERGGIFKHSDRNTFHVEIDGRLITGQNHLSSKPVAEKVIELLENNVD